MSKQTVYLITFVVCILFQAGIAPAIAIGGCLPNFLIIPVLLVSLRSGSGMGSIAGFACGLLYDLMSNGTVGCMALVFVLVALAVGVVGSGTDTQSPLFTCLVAVVASFLVEFVYGIAATLTNTDSSGALITMLTHAFPTALYTAVFACIALATIGLVMVGDSPAMSPRRGSPIGGKARKMPKMGSRLK